MNKTVLVIFAIAAISVNAGELYKKFQPEQTSSHRENVEWSKSYTYNARNVKSPRCLMIGDSICNDYHGVVRKRLGRKANASFWATSKCVTDKDYFRELDFILSGYRFDVITFNNGLHSLSTNIKEWENAYRLAIKFIKARCPDSKLFIVLSTPLNNSKRATRVIALNAITRKIAAEEKVSIINLFSPMDKLDRKQNWRDKYHFKSKAIDTQASLMAKAILFALFEG